MLCVVCVCVLLIGDALLLCKSAWKDYEPIS